MKLTDLAIRNLPLPDKGQKTYWEKGLGVRVSQGGTKTFVAKHEGKWVTLGRYPATSLKTARRQHLELQVVQPPSDRLQTLSEARELYLSECEQKNRPKTVEQYRLFLFKVDRQLLTDVQKTDIDTTSPHAVMVWRVFFNWCIRNELIEKNPFAHIKAQWNARERTLTDEELKAVWDYDFPPFSNYLKFMILTGCRVGECIHFVPDENTITIDGSHTKNKRSHTLPLTELLASLLPLQPFNGWSKAKARLDKHVPLPHWTLHDLRRTFATNHARLGTPIHVVEAMLNHSSGSVSGVAAVYIRHNFLQEARTAQRSYEQFLGGVLQWE